MKKALSIFVTLVFALTMVTAAVSANADGLDDVIDASALSSIQDVINSSTDEIVPITVGNGMVTKTVVGSNTMVLTALPLEDSEFVAWYTSLSDLRKDKRYSEANPLRVDMKGTQRYFYAYFKNPNATTTSSISVTVPTNITIPSRTTTDSDVSSQLTTSTTASQITADSKMVESAYSIANEFSKSLSKANTTTTSKATTTTKATKKASNKNKPKKTKIKSVKGKKNGFKITWKKVSGVKGYQIKYSTNKYFFESLTKSKNVKKAKTTSATVKNLRKGKTYFVKVRTYKIVKGKKVYSNWSKVKTVTAK
jgi:hypothetical protein